MSDKTSNSFHQVKYNTFRFNQVQDAQEFPIPKAENVFTFHVKRKIPVERILGQRYDKLFQFYA